MIPYMQKIERVKAAIDGRTQKDIGDFMGVKQSTVCDAIRREAIPARWLVVLYRKLRINPDWIEGRSSAKYVQEMQYPDNRVQEARETARREVIEEIREYINKMEEK